MNKFLYLMEIVREMVMM